ncbi:MAG: T9SS type A sorting domain-containing protein [Dysgonamonadaceae bacterium]|jgi:hypothetical protein|nr:T9SS type A sorting domain-containing protein [Dysgonamonadaceae bacterium]
MRKIFTNAILTLAFFFGASVSSAFAEKVDISTVPATGGSGDGWVAEEHTESNSLRFTVTKDVTFTGTNDVAQFFVPKDKTVTITLEDVVVKNGFASPLIVESEGEDAGGVLTLELVGENELIVANVNTQAAAVTVEGAATITFKGDGQLKAYGAGLNTTGAYGGGAGIGTGAGVAATTWPTSGTISIESGIIIAQGGYNASGIGGGYSGDSGEINITGGTIFTTSIGCGSHGFTGPINISGDATLYMNWCLGGKVYNTDPGHPKQGQAYSFNYGGNAVAFIDTDDSGWMQRAEISDNFQYYIFDDQIFEKTGARVEFPSFYDHSNATRDPLETDFEDALVTLYGGNLNLDVPPGEVWIFGPVLVPEYLTIEGWNELTEFSAIVRRQDGGDFIAREGSNVRYGKDEPALKGGEGTGLVHNVDFGDVTPIKTIGKSDLNVSLRNDEISVEGAAIKALTVYSINGQTLISKAGNTVSVSSLPKGSYIVSIEAENGKTSAKFVK